MAFTEDKPIELSKFGFVFPYRVIVETTFGWLPIITDTGGVPFITDMVYRANALLLEQFKRRPRE